MNNKNTRLMTRIPQISWLLAFISVAENRNFTIAARELRLTQPAVSQRISKLEGLLKTQLFLRSPKSVELTDAGKVLLEQLHVPFDELLSVLENYNKPHTSKTLSIETEPVWNRIMLAPKLSSFLKNHPDIVFRQALTTHHLDFSLGTELAIKWGDGNWEGFDAQFLSGLDYLPVCSPSYLKEHRLADIDDLANATILHERDYSDWLYWLKYYPSRTLDLNAGHVVGESNVLMSLAISGLGVALCGYDLVKPYIDSNELVFPFPEMKVRHHKAYYVLTRKNQRLSEQAKLFIQFLNEITLVERALPK